MWWPIRRCRKHRAPPAWQKLRPALTALPGVASVAAPGEELARDWPELSAWAVWNLAPEYFARVLAALAPARRAGRWEFGKALR